MTEKQEHSQTKPPVRKKRRRLYESVTEEPLETVPATEAKTEFRAVAVTEEPLKAGTPSEPAGSLVLPQESEQGAATRASIRKQASDVPQEQLDSILRHHVWGAMAVGLAPVPLIDLVGVTAVQINLARRLAQVYRVPFFRNSAKTAISVLMGSVLPVAAAPRVAFSLIKAIPGSGQIIGVMTMPVLAGASTYALGKVFIQHFASGNTFLTFDPETFKDYYHKMFKEGQQTTAKMKKEKE